MGKRWTRYSTRIITRNVIRISKQMHLCKGAIHRCQLPGIPLAAWLIDELRVREDITGTMYNHALGMPHDWHFALIAIDD